MKYINLNDNILGSSGGCDRLLKYDPATGQSWIISYDEAGQPGDRDDPRDEWLFEEAEGVVPDDVWARAVAARKRLGRSGTA